jgi:D-sedoheptulose 7-phosphate isomerase
MYDDIQGYWRDISKLARRMPVSAIAEAAELLLDCHRAGGTTFVFGNGGSAATASHMACDLAKGARVAGTPPFRVVALTDNVPLMTAWGNDDSYTSIFAEQLAALVRPGDLVVAISASGNSPNVLAAAALARDAGATVLALTGATGGRLRVLADLAILVPSPSIEQVEDAHMMVAHSLCIALREQLHAQTAILEQPVPLELEVGGV